MSGGLIRAAGPEIPYGSADVFADPEVGLWLSTHKARRQESFTVESNGEFAVLALSGRGMLSSAGRMLHFDRPNWIDTNPTVIHATAGSSVIVGAEDEGP